VTASREVVGSDCGRHDEYPAQFVSFFCRTHRGCGPGIEITRIEWRYLD